MTVPEAVQGVGSLEGVVVLDVSRVVAGPYCSQILADLGATVIKVENPRDPDYTRTFPPFLGGDPDGFSAFYAQYNRGKLGITIDLGTDEGKQVLRDLVAKAHILVENFRPGTMEKLGVGYDVLREVNPALVYTAISGYGQTGPLSRRPAYDNTAQAAGGLWSMNGYADRPAVRVGTIIGDLSATMFGVIGTLAALRHAERTGTGQLVDVAQTDSVVAMTESAVVDYTVAGKVAGRLGNQHPFVRPYELFPCKDGFVFFGGYTDKFWRITCEMFGQPEIADDPEIGSMTQRFDDEVYERRVKPLIIGWFASYTKAELEEIAGDRVPMTAVKSMDEVVADEQTVAREMIVDVDYDELGTLRMFGQPIKLGETPATPARKANLVGEHTESVLQDFAGYSASHIEKLRELGAI
ncbi:CoA transferase [Rhodococcus sp. 14-2470-1b]|uniref:CaiB/BaiF CoA transferase family protein n=1 Tax=Rhodococcus sp. 14-2470-1b TaxID=2023149 RepID=UPI000B9B64A5|nr:CaiB/BaiF CoA-transferase family protein [Rhodococcus sp. 14-2470-1b]OZF52146.1 CoA transferase [Rhodococcus sp. 14-2470-1b]